MYTSITLVICADNAESYSCFSRKGMTIQNNSIYICMNIHLAFYAISEYPLSVNKKKLLSNTANLIHNTIQLLGVKFCCSFKSVCKARCHFTMQLMRHSNDLYLLNPVTMDFPANELCLQSISNLIKANTSNSFRFWRLFPYSRTRNHCT